MSRVSFACWFPDDFKSYACHCIRYAILFITESIRVTNNEQDAQLDLLKHEIDKAFSYRTQLTTTEAYDIHRLALSKMEGENSNYSISRKSLFDRIKEKYKNKVFTVDGKDYTRDALVDKIINDYDVFHKKMGDTWIHAKDKNGNYIDWDEVDWEKYSDEP